MPKNPADKRFLDARLTEIQIEAVLGVVEDEKREAHPIDKQAMERLRLRFDKLRMLAAAGAVY